MLLATIKKLSQDYHESTRALRRHLHANPELSYQENATAAFVADTLSSFGIKATTGIADTGLSALIEGKNPSKKIVALRADMDALPIHEQNEVDYKSKRSGVMHACGHDAHTACLLTTMPPIGEYTVRRSLGFPLVSSSAICSAIARCSRPGWRQTPPALRHARSRRASRCFSPAGCCRDWVRRWC